MVTTRGGQGQAWVRAGLVLATVGTLLGAFAGTLRPAGAEGATPEARRAARRAAAVEAAREIRATHLFEGGRGMHALPGIPALLRVGRGFAPGAIDAALTDDLGLVLDEHGVAGLHAVRAGTFEVPVFGCAACHTGRAAGRTIVGLGNKRIDVGAIGRVQLGLAASPRFAWPVLGRTDRRLVAQALDTARLLVDARWRTPTQGLVPVAAIRSWFFRVQGVAPPAAEALTAKVPHLWGYAAKRKVGLFCDGFADGGNGGWGAMVEAAAGQTPQAIRAYQPRVERVEALFERLLPPRYPFPIDGPAAARGAHVFSATCAGCHGDYALDADGFPDFQPPLYVPHAQVGTDGERLGLVTPAFRELVRRSPLGDLARLTALQGGYFAPRLDGIWARFPYLHNAAVPSLAALLTPPGQRPRVWALDRAGEAGRFDARAVGLTLPPAGSAAEARLLHLAGRGARHVYDVRRPGHGNQGHDFGTDLAPAAKRDLIEYLKTL